MEIRYSALIICAITLSSTASVLRTKRETSPSGYIQFYPGTLNVILSAPHGGYKRPSSIPNRGPGCWDAQTEECIWTHTCGQTDPDKCGAKTLNDLNTKKLALELRNQLYQDTGEYPYVVINNLRRIKLDANRDKPEATFGVPVAEEAWEEYHQYIDQWKGDIGGQGLFLDLHGQSHPNNWAELGYLISGSKLDSGSFSADTSSIRYLASQVNVTFEELLRGSTSFGGFLEQNSFRAVPSPGDPGPDGEKYFSGGYNTRRHGSRDSGQIDAIQIESSSTQRSNSVRPQYVQALSSTIKAYMEAHYPRRN